MSTEDELIDEVCKLLGRLDNLRIWKAKMLAVKPDEILVIQLPDFYRVSEQAKKRYCRMVIEKLGINKILITDASVEVYAARNSSNVSTETELVKWWDV
jgi:hypothetical protein